MNECPNLATCPFFEKFKDTDELVCLGFIRMYCRGDRQKECKRMEYKSKTGNKPPDEMMPNGVMMVQKKD